MGWKAAARHLGLAFKAFAQYEEPPGGCGAPPIDDPVPPTPERVADGDAAAAEREARAYEAELAASAAAAAMAAVARAAASTPAPSAPASGTAAPSTPAPASAGSQGLDEHGVCCGRVGSKFAAEWSLSVELPTPSEGCV